MTDGPPRAETGNPFAAPAADPVPVSVRFVAWRTAVGFVIRSVLILFVLPLLFAALAGLMGFRWWWVIVPTAWLFQGPVTTLQIVDRFLAPVRDPTPIVFANGLVMDRWRFRRLVRAVLAERVVMSVLIVAFVGPILGQLAVVLLPFLLLFAAWTVWFSFQNVRISDSVVALVEEDHETVVRRAGAVLAHPILNRMLLPVAALHVGAAKLRLGDALGAIEALEKVPRSAMPQAHLTRAWLLAAQGRVPEARKALDGRSPTNLGERIAHQYALSAIALEEGDAAAVLERAKTWSDLRDDQPKAIREGFDLVEAGALALLGRSDDARALLEATGASPANRPWFEATWPRLWAALRGLLSPA